MYIRLWSDLGDVEVRGVGEVSENAGEELAKERDDVVEGTNNEMNGSDVVIFDEELVNTGSAKWNLTVYGYFVGMIMNFTELRYIIMRMWGRYGLGEMFATNNDVYCFKFKHEYGPEKVPLWIKMFDITLEAWSAKGISALASILGKPLIMDDMTAQMCQYGKGRIGYARVLVEKVKVECLWKPAKCNHCNVFGHNFTMCKARPKTKEKMVKLQEEKEKNKAMSDNFVPIKNQGAKRQVNDGRMYNSDMRTSSLFSSTRPWEGVGLD
ncbi:RNA-directed DNA polymerase, eukaryota, reverse transcriptase zinc-binding domain protein [Tanacetum coccineum]